MSNKILYLLRHARTHEKQSGQTDFERELSAVGLQNSTRMGINFLNKNITFDMIVSSPAERAQKTASLIAEQLKFDTAKIHFNDIIYEASVRNLLQLVNNFKEEWRCALLIGHNPAISYLTEYICESSVGDITTCGVVKIQFQKLKWSEISEKSGKFISYEYPELLNFN